MSICRYMLPHNQRPLKLASLEFIDPLAPILHNHDVYDHTSSHHILHCVQNPSSYRVINNNPTILKETKCSLHILPTTFLLSHTQLVFPWMDIVYTNVDHEG
jgi:hypothetical protein